VRSLWSRTTLSCIGRVAVAPLGRRCSTATRPEFFWGWGIYHKLRTATRRLHVATIAPPLCGGRRAMRATMPDEISTMPVPDMALLLQRAYGALKLLNF